MTGTIKWLMLSMVFCVFAIIIMLAGLYRSNRVTNGVTYSPEEEEENKKYGKKIFVKHSVVSGALLVIAILIFFINKG